MLRKVSVILSLLLAIAVLAPSIASAAQAGCEGHQAQSCHGLEVDQSQKESDSASHSHKCAVHHSCCHSPANMPQALLATRIPATALSFAGGYFYSVSSTFLESPLQPPEA